MSDIPGSALPNPPTVSDSSRRQWPIYSILVIALLITLGVAITGWFRPIPGDKSQAAPTYTSLQVDDAKTHVCEAYNSVHRAVGMNMGRDGGSDQIAQLAVATSARQTLIAGSNYLLSTLSEYPATAPDLAAAIRKLAMLFQQYTIDYLNGHTNAQMESSLRAGDETTVTIEKLCK